MHDIMNQLEDHTMLSVKFCPKSIFSKTFFELQICVPKLSLQLESTVTKIPNRPPFQNSEISQLSGISP